jgi:proliferating cell nuclear antigen
MEPDRARYPLHIKTVQGSSLKGLFEVLKELLNDVNVVVNQSGIKILAMDSAQVTLCHCLLEAQNFEVFHCPETVVIGLNVQNLYKLLKIVSSQDTLTLQIESDSPNDLEIIIQNSEKKSKTFFKLRLLDINDDRLKVPNVEMTTCITMASVDFQRLIRDMLTVGSVLRVRVKKGEVIFETSGDFATQRTILETSEDTKVNESDDEIDLSFSLKLLSLFSKASTLSTLCSLWLQADFPLIVQYAVGNLGHIRMILAAKLA